MISVVLYVHNGAKYLPAALDSILGQTYRDFELFVLDDGSTDATPDILAAVTDPRLRWERQAAKGRHRLHETFNRCLEATTGELVAVANADDVWVPEKLARQVACFHADPALDVCFHDAYFVDAAGRHTLLSFRTVPSPNPITDIRGRRFFLGDPVPNPTVLFRRSILRAVGAQETGWVHDYQFWMKAAVAGCRFLGLADRLICYRVHEESHSTSSANRDRLRRENQAMLRSMAARYDLGQLYPELAACGDGPASLAYAHFDLALLLMQAGLDDLAQAHLEQVLALRPEHPAALHNLAILFVMGRRLDVGRALLHRASVAACPLAQSTLARVEQGVVPHDGWSPASWGQEEPELAALAAGPFVPPPRAGVPAARTLVVLAPGADVSVLPPLFAGLLRGEGPPAPVVVLTGSPTMTQGVVDAFAAAEAGVGGAAVDVDVHLVEADLGALDSLVEAHRMDHPQVVIAPGPSPWTRAPLSA